MIVPHGRSSYVAQMAVDRLNEEAHRLGGRAWIPPETGDWWHDSYEAGLELNGSRTDDAQFATLVRLPGFRYVTWVNLADARITDRTLELLANRQPLAVLDVSGTKVTDEGLKSIARMRSLGEFRARGTAISDAGLEILAAHAESLRMGSISLDNTRGTDKGAETLRMAFPQMQIHYGRGKTLPPPPPGPPGLGLSPNRPQGPGRNELTELNRLSEEARRLQGSAGVATLAGTIEVNLRGTRTDDEQFAKLVHMPGFRQVAFVLLAGTRITDRSLKLLEGNRTVSTLDISRTKITDDALRSITTMPGLQVLNLSGTGVSDAGLQALIDHAATLRPRTVNLGDTKVTDKGVERLRKAFPGTQIDPGQKGNRSPKP
ncbi:MAG: hypothetical protein ACP5XB_00970 [Isosphaeraceae bacterium]